MTTDRGHRAATATLAVVAAVLCTLGLAASISGGSTPGALVSGLGLILAVILLAAVA